MEIDVDIDIGIYRHALFGEFTDKAPRGAELQSLHDREDGLSGHFS